MKGEDRKQNQKKNVIRSLPEKTLEMIVSFSRKRVHVLLVIIKIDEFGRNINVSATGRINR